MWGVSALSHDAALAVSVGGSVVFASHAERYSRVKNDPLLNNDLIQDALQVAGMPSRVVWYEKPLLKKARHLRAGQWSEAFTTADLPNRYLRSFRLGLPAAEFVAHHDSHLAAGVATSGFHDCAVIVADAIGEFRTFTVARHSSAEGTEVLARLRYPHSLGLLYSAFTRRCGFRPNEDEYVVMGMAAFGEPRYVSEIYDELVAANGPLFRLRFNPHRGIGDWLPDASPEDLAASVQLVTEEIMLRAAGYARRATGSGNLVLGGGVALNCVANTRIAAEAGFDAVHIFPNPGDAGSAVGALAVSVMDRLEWPGPYTGHEIAGEWPVDGLLRHLMSGEPVGVASGRAEFGPRALGNRSLLADPRGAHTKDAVNRVKGREPFRPFAPVVREERFAEVFDAPTRTSPYMQFTARCREPHLYPGIVHEDGTSRAQTVTSSQHPGLYSLLVAWEDATGCPVLLNTSLNRRGEPLVNDRKDADDFADATGVVVL